jgi:opacity protein-like surface antigen
MKNKLIGALLLATTASAGAKDVEITCSNCQQAFESISEDLVAAIDYKAMGPAEATGITGIGVGVVATYVPIDADAEWQQVTGQDFSGLGLVGLQVTKGLPLDLDVGAFYSTVPGTNVDLYGAEVRYAFLAGSTTTPALSLRGSYVMVSGIDSFDLDSKSIELALSKGFGPITPYVGVGYVWGSADPDSSTGLTEAKVEEAKATLGVRLSLGLFEMTPQAAQIGDVATYGLRLGFSF